MLNYFNLHYVTMKHHYNCRGGLYCGPLRLLALEVFESLNRQGVYTDLSTGQEKREVDFSTHISCTVEMVRLDKEYDVAVIDEIQMIANDQRGFAWLVSPFTTQSCCCLLNSKEASYSRINSLQCLCVIIYCYTMSCHTIPHDTK